MKTSPEMIVPQTVDRDRLKHLLTSLMLDEERGAVWELRHSIQRCVPLFASVEDQELKAKFETIKARAKNAFEFEEENGVRSLFNHEHPFNRQLDQDGLIDLRSFPPTSEKSGAFWGDYFSRAGLGS